MSKTSTNAVIDSNITTNGKGEITGAKLNTTLKAMVSDYGTQADLAAVQARMTAAEGDISAMSLDLDGVIADMETSDDFYELPKMCGQPMILFGTGTPQESIVPDNWIQLADGGYNWNGLPSALGQQYINTSVTSGGHYTAVRSGEYDLKWINC